MKTVSNILALIGLLGVFATQTSLVQADSKPLHSDSYVSIDVIQEDIDPTASFFDIGVRFKIEDGWHIYWINPGDSGAAPTIQWTLPPGVGASGMTWPTPKKFPLGPLANFGYDKEVIFPVHFAREDSVPFPINLKASLKWLVCKEDCVPGGTEITFLVSPEINTYNNEFKQALLFTPEAKLVVPSKLTFSGSTAKLKFNHNIVDFQSVEFFPETQGIFENAAPQSFNQIKDGFQINWQKSSYYNPTTRDGRGLVVFKTGSGERKSFETSFKIPKLGIVKRMLREDNNLVYLLLLAFIGGIVLNAMPCVFPVLSIKLLSLIKFDRNSKSSIRLHGLAYTLGVVFSMLLLAFGLIITRSLGTVLGWGFQLQSPIFVTVMLLFILIWAINLLGVFEFGQNAQYLAGKINEPKGYRGSFVGGILSTVLATPCSAPFMGTAVAGALSRSSIEGLLIFLFLGLGLSSPYLLLTLFPSMIKILPRPGAWMEYLKKFLSVPLLMTCLWLIWVLTKQINSLGILFILLLVASVTIGCVITGLYQRRKISPFVRTFGRILIVSSFFAPIFFVNNFQTTYADNNPSYETEWKNFSEEELHRYVNDGQPVFLDFTAAWCITCQVNKRLILNTSDFINLMKEHDVVLMRADWTNVDPLITKALETFGRESVPTNVLYLPNKEPVVFPTVFSLNNILEEFKDY